MACSQRKNGRNRENGNANASDNSLIGRIVSGYRILNRIGGGFSGVIYRAETDAKFATLKTPPNNTKSSQKKNESDQSNQKIVAIKFLRSWNHDEQGFARFERESRTLSRLNHSNIARLIETGFHDETPFLVMPFIDGLTLGEQIHEHPELPLKQRIHWFVKICQAIAFAHQNQIIHRDLKPSNILIECENESGERRVVVTDFGIAKSLDTTHRELTRTGEFLGTPRFMAPEQIDSENEINALADVYGLGAILYFLLTGKAPFDDVSIHQVPNAVLTSMPNPPGKVVKIAALEKDLETICLKCLNTDKASRYQSVPELLAEIDRWQGKRPIHAKPTPLIRRFRLWSQANPHVTIMGAALITTNMISLLVLSYLWRQAQQQSEDRFELLKMQVQQEIDLREDSTQAVVRIGMLKTITNGFDALEQKRGRLDDEMLRMSAVAWYNLARFERSYSSVGNELAERRSKQQFEALARRFPNELEHRFSLFHWQNLFGSPNGAYQIIHSLIEDDPGNEAYLDCLANACYLRGRELFHAGEFRSAIQALTEGITTVDELIRSSQESQQHRFAKHYIRLHTFRAKANWAINLPKKAEDDIHSAIHFGEEVLPSFPQDYEVPAAYTDALWFAAGDAMTNNNWESAYDFIQKSQTLLESSLSHRKYKFQYWGVCGKILLLNWMYFEASGDIQEAEKWKRELNGHCAAWKADGRYPFGRAGLYSKLLIGQMDQLPLTVIEAELAKECGDLPEFSSVNILLSVARCDLDSAQQLLNRWSNDSDANSKPATTEQIYKRLLAHAASLGPDEWEPFVLTETEKQTAVAWSGFSLQFAIEALNRFFDKCLEDRSSQNEFGIEL
ncbi:MAG: serine/threonine-protein kinase [Pirellulaceae bacterium]